MLIKYHYFKRSPTEISDPPNLFIFLIFSLINNVPREQIITIFCLCTIDYIKIKRSYGLTRTALGAMLNGKKITTGSTFDSKMNTKNKTIIRRIEMLNGEACSKKIKP